MARKKVETKVEVEAQEQVQPEVQEWMEPFPSSGVVRVKVVQDISIGKIKGKVGEVIVLPVEVAHAHPHAFTKAE